LRAVEEIGYSARVDLQARQRPPQRFEIAALQVFRAAFRRVEALEIDSPEVVFPKRQLRDDGFDGVADEFADAAWILLDDLVALRPRHAEQCEREVARHEPHEPRRPDAMTDL